MPVPAVQTKGLAPPEDVPQNASAPTEVVGASLLTASAVEEDYPAVGNIEVRVSEVADTVEKGKKNDDHARSTFRFKDPKKSVSDASPEELLEAFAHKNSSAETMDKLISRIGKMDRSEQRTKTKAKVLLSLVVILIMVVGGLIGAMWWIVDSAKESHVQDGVMVDLGGESVATRSVESYADLFVLYKFDMKTLHSVKYVDMVTRDNRQVSLSIHGVEKTLVPNTTAINTVTLFSTGANKVTIFPFLGRAAVELDGNLYHVLEHPERRRLREDGLLEAKLHTASEWFVEKNGINGDGSRRMQLLDFGSTAVTFSTFSFSGASESTESCSLPPSEFSSDDQLYKDLVDDDKGWSPDTYTSKSTGKCSNWQKSLNVDRRRRRRDAIHRRRRSTATTSQREAGKDCYADAYNAMDRRLQSDKEPAPKERTVEPAPEERTLRAAAAARSEDSRRLPAKGLERALEDKACTVSR